MNSFTRTLAVTYIAILLFQGTPFSQTGNNWVDGDLMEFIDDGAWCWFQDERAVVDTANGKLIVSSTNSQASVDLIIYDLSSGQVEDVWTSPRMQYADDHNAPGLEILPNGNYLAIWAHHYDEWNSRYSIYDGQSWSSERQFDWQTIPGGTNYTIAYSNVYYLSEEDRVYNFARANNRTPNFLYSDDNGNSWQFGGQLTTNNSNSYNKGYYKYWGNGVDRIDFVLTEEHPRNRTTSLYHGYLQDGKTYDTEGNVADDDIYDLGTIPTYEDFTRVMAHGSQFSEAPGVSMGRLWQSDIMRYDDGTIVILLKARADDSETDHRNFYARYDGEDWKVTYIGKAGTKMYDSEEDYTGLGAISPETPDRIYISSPFNPGDDNSTPGKREIWRGTSEDDGDTWEWEPVTANSSEDNFRPIIPKWNADNEVVLWFRGTYTSAQKFESRIVGTFYQYGVVDVRDGKRLNPETTAIKVLPLGSKVAMQFTVSKEAPVRLETFSASGKKVASLVNETLPAGQHTATWKPKSVSSGVYLAKFTIGEHSRIKQFVIQN